MKERQGPGAGGHGTARGRWQQWPLDGGHHCIDPRRGWWGDMPEFRRSWKLQSHQEARIGA